MNIQTVLPVDVHAPNGRIDVTYGLRGGQTIVDSIYEKHPLRLLRPGAQKAIQTGVVVNTSGGVVGGDQLAVSIRCRSGTKACLTSQAAEKVYRSTGADACLRNTLTLDAGSWTEWLPHETILFEGSRFRRAINVKAETGAQLLAGDLIVFGRTAMKERMTTGLFRDAWSVRIDGRLTWCDTFLLDNNVDALLKTPAGLNGATSMGTLIYAGNDAAEHLDCARHLAKELSTPAIKCGATCVQQILIMRFLSLDFSALRVAFGEAWGALRHDIAKLPAETPRNWNL